MARFDINKKGYDTEQVDNFIGKLSLKYEEKLSEQKDRVFALKNELAVMQERLNNYRDKDKQVSQALVFAVEKAEQIEKQSEEAERESLLHPVTISEDGEDSEDKANGVASDLDSDADDEDYTSDEDDISEDEE